MKVLRLAPLLVSLAVGCGGGEGGAALDDGGVVADAGPPPDLPPPSDGPGRDGGALYGEQPFSIALLPDTQFYAQLYPEMFIAETAWLVEQKQALNLAFVLHLGDIVQTPNVQPEWDRANDALKMLDAARIPYVLCAGNHDTILTDRSAEVMNQNFPASRFAPALQGTLAPNKIENAYYFLPAGGRTWLIVALEFGPRDEVLAWADGIFKQNADKPAILLTHAYMYLGQQRYDWIKHPDPMQYWNPHGYNLPGTTNDGEEMFQKMVSKNDNILLVVSGHATNATGSAGLLSTKRSNGYYLHEMLANYQGCPSDYMCINPETMRPVRGGEGMLRIIHMDPPNRRATVETYSPYLKMSRMDAPHHFDLPLE